MKRLAARMALVAALITTTFQAQAEVQQATQTGLDATITRTEFNIPHIESETWQGLGYGVAYAYAQDNFCLLAEELATVAGERSLHFGPENEAILGFQSVDNLSSDVFHRSQIDLPKLQAGWSKQSLEVRQLVKGYVAGYNRYLRDTSPAGLPKECRNGSWVRQISVDDMLRLNEKQMLLASSLVLAPGIANATPPISGNSETASLQLALPERGQPGFGSNGWAFGGAATADGKGLLIGNPHFPWNGPARFWQLHVTLDGQIDAMGVGLAGNPLPTLGFNRDMAWTHTVTAARHFTLYALNLVDGDPTSYLVDGKPEKMTAREIVVPMPDGASPVSRTLYSTRWGPVVIMPSSGVVWSAGNAIALRDANTGNQRGIETWLRIAQSKSVEDVRQAISASLGIPWVNTIAADRNGNALHADVTAVPNVSAQKIAECSTPASPIFASLATLLDGSRSECGWDVSPEASVAGLLPASQQSVKIRRDYLTNSNDSYWLSNPRQPFAKLSPILGDHEQALSLRTRSNFKETEALLAQGMIDHERALELVFANKSLAADMVIEPLLRLCAGQAEYADACGALDGWDNRYDIDSRGGYLFQVFWDKIRRNTGLWSVPFDASDPINTPRELNTSDAAGEALLTSLAEAAADLSNAEIALDAQWGEVLAVRLDDENIAIHGGPGLAGVLNMQNGRLVNEGMVPQHGSSYIQIVGFDENGPVADAILSYSQSSNPASDHFADQTRVYAEKRMHRLPFAREDIDAGKIAEAIRISE
jgi:acyl-homoserine-lactone acylase